MYSKLSEQMILNDLGKRVVQLRIQMNMTQQEIADQAGVSKRTVERFEHGESIQLRSMIRLLRVLDAVDNLQDLFPDQEESPMELLRNSKQKKHRKRVYSRNKHDYSVAADPWKWGDEK